ncbi:DUF4383 domain-containing protein [Amycolatopsis cynarae]|uniref:DUF4383 domain-containing protein n=1 Tax=Amycolatopsis cynarae TaxID=2995223 RepID=A0ABY7AUH7_9PSEU|nr:DUF4383 domain-containing protein [Amycolatopsis sp. HUAS 11-8]WAL63617.1 DUF4383 domain-containing protein [Amycolatopsis sp. HUAS 11-8]
MAGQSGQRDAAVAQMLSLVIGVVYLALGIGGFFAGGQRFLGLHTDPILDLVRTAIGLVALGCARRRIYAQVLGLVLFFGMAGLTVYGVLSTGTGETENLEYGVAALGWEDDTLHGLTAVAGLAMGLWPQRTTPDRVSSGHKE